MNECTVMVYNIESMGEMFKGSEIRPESAERALRLAEQIGSIGPHILGIVEASDRTAHHEAFLRLPPLANAGYQIARSTHKRGKHDLAIYYRHPFSVVDVDCGYDFYGDWTEDIDDDGILEVCSFERRPLEILFGVDGIDKTFRVVLVAAKSKGVFSVEDIIGYQNRALANRKRQLAQCKKLRARADQLLQEEPNAAFVVMGDFNDGPGMDNFQRLVGASALETAMGNVFEPERILHNTLHYLVAEGNEIWTASYQDVVVANSRPHRAWLDHILVSPAMLRPDAAIRYVRRSGGLGAAPGKSGEGMALSDHRPIYCKVSIS